MISEERFIAAIRSDARLKHCFIRTYPFTISKSGPLQGLSCAVKDNISIAGHPVTFGMNPAAIAKAETDAAIVSLLKSNGSTIVGSTNLDEGCLNYLGDNRHYGRMLNPYDPNRIVSGSSGGSALAVACDVADIGVGTDMGGSIRGPAACTGLYGLKCSFNRFSLEGVLALAPSFESIGFLAKTLDDLSRTLKGLGIFEQAKQFSEILLPAESEISELAEPIRIALMRTAQRLKVRQLNEPLGFLRARQLRKILVASEMAERIKVLKIDPNSLPSEGLAVLELAKRLKVEEIESAKIEREKLAIRIRDIVGLDRAILYPTFAGEPPTWGEISSGKLTRAGQLGRFLALTNIAGLPALAFPVSSNQTLIAPSLQLMGPLGSEQSLLELADL